MTYWITRLSGDQPSDNRFLANQFVAESARQLGFKPINYVLWSTRDLTDPERRKAVIETMFGQVKSGDTVVMTYPMYVMNWAFSVEALDYLTKMDGVKTIGFVIDLHTWLSERPYDKHIDGSLQQLREFDVIIVPTEKFAERLREDDVHTKVIAFNFLDFIYKGPIRPKSFQKKVYIASGRPIWLTNYDGNVDITVIGDCHTKADHITTLEHRKAVALPMLFDGGFAAVDMVKNVTTNKPGTSYDWDKYSEYTAPSKQALYMASGMPLIVRPENANAAIIKARGIGLVMEDLSELDEILEKMTEQEYNKMVENLRPFQKAVASGFFAKEAIMEALAYLEIGATERLVPEKKKGNQEK